MPGSAQHAPDDLQATAFYRAVMQVLIDHRIAFLVGGTYALERHAAISRGTKDLDLFVAREDWDRIRRAMQRAGFRTELPFTHWLGKVLGDNQLLVDLVFAGGNGLAKVDADWFTYAVEENVCGLSVRLCPAEEMIWSKSFVMERERFDGADVMHVIRASGPAIDWSRLLERFGSAWRILLAQLVCFGFVYPTERTAVPGWVLDTLLDRLRNEPAPAERVCRGTLLSRLQYLVDITEWGYVDARAEPHGCMTRDEIDRWTSAAFEEP